MKHFSVVLLAAGLFAGVSSSEAGPITSLKVTSATNLKDRAYGDHIVILAHGANAARVKCSHSLFNTNEGRHLYLETDHVSATKMFRTERDCRSALNLILNADPARPVEVLIDATKIIGVNEI